MVTKSAKQTFNLGKKLAAKLRGGEVLALTGPLGAGKTIFVKGLAAGLGVKQIITSPTFTLMKVYDVNRLPITAYRSGGKRSAVSGKHSAINKLIHLDCYRINDPQAIIDIGALDYFGRPDTISVVEWAERIKPILPLQTIKITIKLKSPLRPSASTRNRDERSEASENKREITIKPYGKNKSSFIRIKTICSGILRRYPGKL